MIDIYTAITLSFLIMIEWTVVSIIMFKISKEKKEERKGGMV